MLSRGEGVGGLGNAPKIFFFKDVNILYELQGLSERMSKVKCAASSQGLYVGFLGQALVRMEKLLMHVWTNLFYGLATVVTEDAANSQAKAAII